VQPRRARVHEHASPPPRRAAAQAGRNLIDVIARELARLRGGGASAAANRVDAERLLHEAFDDLRRPRRA
jgi:hypothetical protein